MPGMVGGPFAYVDPFLLAGVDVQRGAVVGGDGAGTLAGSANFRTLDIDDLLGEGRGRGLRAGYRHGNNRLAAAYLRLPGATVKRVATASGLLAAASSSRSEYATARGQKNNADPGSQQPSSWLLKARLQPSDQHRLDLSHMRYENDFYHNYPWQIPRATNAPATATRPIRRGSTCARLLPATRPGCSTPGGGFQLHRPPHPQQPEQLDRGQHQPLRHRGTAGAGTPASSTNRTSLWPILPTCAVPTRKVAASWTACSARWSCSTTSTH